jgi:RimJ/RimL family protein N-acetyltransferase
MEKGLIRIHACHLSRNPASGRVMEKLGMSHEGTRKQHILKWEVFENMELRGILRSQWMNLSGNSNVASASVK